MANNTNRSFVITEGSKSSTAFLAALMATNNRGMITGKLKTGINRLPLPDLDAIEEIKVNVDENPMPPNAMVMIKYNAFPTGKPRNKLYVPKHNKASSTVKMAL